MATSCSVADAAIALTTIGNLPQEQTVASPSNIIVEGTASDSLGLPTIARDSLAEEAKNDTGAPQIEELPNENVTPVSHAAERSSRARGRGKKFSLNEDFIVSKAFISASSDPIKGADQTKAAFNEKFRKRYDSYVTKVIGQGRRDKATDPTDKEDDEQVKDLILSSVADLIDASGILKKPEDPTKITDDMQMLEADIALSCMTPKEHDETKRDEDLEREAHFRIFQGRESAFSAEDDRLDEDGVLSEADDDSQAGDDGEGMDDLLSQDGIDDDFNDEDDDNILDFDEDDIGSEEEKEPRAFLKLWSTLSEWVTPQAVEWLVDLEKNVDTSSPSRTTFHDWTPQVNRSNLGASRCAALMAMVKMNLSTSLKELNRGSDLHRQAELRLGDWLRTFDYSAPMAKLHLSLWKTLTCILLDFILVETRAKATEIALPKPVATVGMTLDEYRYITRSAVQSLGKTL